MGEKIIMANKSAKPLENSIHLSLQGCRRHTRSGGRQALYRHEWRCIPEHLQKTSRAERHWNCNLPETDTEEPTLISSLLTMSAHVHFVLLAYSSDVNLPPCT